MVQTALLQDELKPLLNPWVLTSATSGTLWSIDTLNNRIMYIEHCAKSARYVITSQISSGQCQNKEALYPILLGYNSQWRHTGHLVAALNSQQEILLSFSVSDVGLSATTLYQLINRFLTKVDQFEALVALY